MQDAWNTFASRLRTKLEALKDPTPDYTMDELIMYLRDYRRRGPDTIRKRVNQLGFMELHPQMPVKLHGTRFELVNTFYLYVRYREDVESAGYGALKNDHKAIRSLGDFLGVPKEVWPTAPTSPSTDERELPTPEQVYDLLHASYSTKPTVDYKHHLVRGLLLLDFAVGVRFPSEAHMLELTDFNPDRHTLVVSEPKKSGRRRTLLLEPEWLCCSSRHPSLANYLDWRSKVAEPSEKAFFLRPNGEPFETKYGIRNFLNKAVKPQFPWFHPYLGRHWCANARLIDSGFNYIQVADWLGHEDVNMLRRAYEHNARIYERLYGTGWIDRIGRRRNVTSVVTPQLRPRRHDTP
jgi:integrase